MLNLLIHLPLNITIQYDANKFETVKVWWFNSSADGGKGSWEELSFVDLGNGVILISLNHTSVFAMTGTEPGVIPDDTNGSTGGGGAGGGGDTGVSDDEPAESIEEPPIFMIIIIIIIAIITVLTIGGAIILIKMSKQGKTISLIQKGEQKTTGGKRIEAPALIAEGKTEEEIVGDPEKAKRSH